jgi:hypothetical protein
MLAAICGPYVGISRNAKCQRLLWDLYASIAMNAKCLRLFKDLYAGIAYLKISLWNL